MDYIIKIEEADFSEINEETGLNLSLNKCHLNHHNQYLENHDNYVGNIRFINLKNPYPPYYAFYCKKTFKLVEELFQEDIINYGYTFTKGINFIDKTIANS